MVPSGTNSDIMLGYHYTGPNTGKCKKRDVKAILPWVHDSLRSFAADALVTDRVDVNSSARTILLRSTALHDKHQHPIPCPSSPVLSTWLLTFWLPYEVHLPLEVGSTYIAFK